MVLKRVINHHQRSVSVCLSLKDLKQSRPCWCRPQLLKYNWQAKGIKLYDYQYSMSVTNLVHVSHIHKKEKKKNKKLQTAHWFLRHSHCSQESLSTPVSKFSYLKHLLDFTLAKLAFCFCNVKILDWRDRMRVFMVSVAESSISASGGCITACGSANES